MLDRRWRKGVEQGLGPVGNGLRRLGVTADALTVFGLLCSIATALLIASGHLAVGLRRSGRLRCRATCSTVRSRGAAVRRAHAGAFFDSVTDRASDALLFMGVAWYLAGQNPHYAILAFAVAACSMLISYERARAESLGVDARGGLMERAERFVFLSVGLVVRHSRAGAVDHARADALHRDPTVCARVPGRRGGRPRPVRPHKVERPGHAAAVLVDGAP